MCGTNVQCADELRIENDTNCNLTPASQAEYNELTSTCSFSLIDFNCKIQRSPQEVCEKITKFYNPLYVKGAIATSGGTPEDGINVPCDDGKGKFLGEYQCLGKKY